MTDATTTAAEAPNTGPPTDRAIELGSIVVPLLKGVLYRAADQARWIALRREVADLGFLHRLGGVARRTDEPRYEVRRVLKAFVDAQWLHEFDERLAEYRVTLDANGGRLPDDRRGGRRAKVSDPTENDQEDVAGFENDGDES